MVYEAVRGVYGNFFISANLTFVIFVNLKLS